jgi:hypothetical protein
MNQMKNNVFESIYHEHMEYFTTKPLSKFFAKYGMEIIDVKNVTPKGGSIRFTVAHKGGSFRVYSSVKKQIEKEFRFGVNKPIVYKKFQKRIDRVKNRLIHLLNTVKRKGCTIAGYGASPTCTVLLHQFELGTKISYLFDDNPLKQNRFSPNFHHPVYSSDAISTLKPDYIVILAWRYTDPILFRNRQYLKNGGKFIIPLPKPKIIDHSS